MAKFTISEAVAKEKIELFLEFYGHEDRLFSSDQEALADIAIKRLTISIREGMLDITKDAETGHIKIKQKLLYPPGDITELDYKVLTGAAKKIIKDKQSAYSKFYTLAGFLTGYGEAAILKLVGRDLSIVEELATLFLLI